jgi:hypothetical protein
MLSEQLQGALNAGMRICCMLHAVQHMCASGVYMGSVDCSNYCEMCSAAWLGSNMLHSGRQGSDSVTCDGLRHIPCCPADVQAARTCRWHVPALVVYRFVGGLLQHVAVPYSSVTPSARNRRSDNSR